MTRKPEPPANVAARNRKARAAKRDRGLVKFPGWVTPKQLAAIKDMLAARKETE